MIRRFIIGVLLSLPCLAPHNDNEADRYDIRILPSLQLTDDNLSTAAAVFVGYVGELSPTAAQALVKYVSSGGGVMFFCGQGAVHRNLRMLQKTAGEVGIIPWEASSAVNFATRDKVIRITMASGNLGSPRVRRAKSNRDLADSLS